MGPNSIGCFDSSTTTIPFRNFCFFRSIFYTITFNRLMCPISTTPLTALIRYFNLYTVVVRLQSTPLSILPPMRFLGYFLQDISLSKRILNLLYSYFLWGSLRFCSYPTVVIYISLTSLQYLKFNGSTFPSAYRHSHFTTIGTVPFCNLTL